MAPRYSSDFLLFLRDSPLCSKPSNLPPVEDWMGLPPDQLRAQQTRSNADRTRVGDSSLLDQTNKRPGLDRHSSRNNANADDPVFAPPRMAFASSRTNSKTFEKDRPGKDGGDLHERFETFRNKNGGSGTDRRRLGDLERDSEVDGWRMVKPRKSFGADGAERFHGKMGGNYRDERRPREREDRDLDAPRDRNTRTLGNFAYDKDGDDLEGRPRNGPVRNKWRNDGQQESVQAPERRHDRHKSWRDRDDIGEERSSGRNQQDRRWGRDRDGRAEREPEWMDEPAPKPREAHTQQDFQKWMEEMKKAKGASDGDRPAETSAQADTETGPSGGMFDKPAVRAAPAVDIGPDKFFLAFGGSSSGLEGTPLGEATDAAQKAKPAGKSSRFTSFFSQAQESPAVRERVDPQVQPTAPPPPPHTGADPGLAGMRLPLSGLPSAQAPDVERQAFAQLLSKLQKQSMSATPPSAAPFTAPPTQDAAAKKSAIQSPEPFQQYGGERKDAAARPPSQGSEDILAPRPQTQTSRPDQLLQNLMGHHQRTSSQNSGRQETRAIANNSNTEFLMNLMRAGPGAGSSDAQRRAQGTASNGPAFPKSGMSEERGPDFERGLGPSTRHMSVSPPQGPPGLPNMGERFHQPAADGMDARQPVQQPTQILQRPLPPGFDQAQGNWSGNPQSQMPPPQRGNMLPPPGLGAGSNAGPGPNGPLPPHLFPPNFPTQGGMMPPLPPPPEGPPHGGLASMSGMSSRNMAPPLPPPGFFNGPPPPPHGFLPPGLAGMNGPPGMGSPGDFMGSPFDGLRGMPPPPPNGGPRGANFGRP